MKNKDFIDKERNKTQPLLNGVTIVLKFNRKVTVFINTQPRLTGPEPQNGTNRHRTRIKTLQ